MEQKSGTWFHAPGCTVEGKTILAQRTALLLLGGGAVSRRESNTAGYFVHFGEKQEAEEDKEVAFCKPQEDDTD